MTKKSTAMDVFLVAGMRTPFLKVRQGPGPFAASDLGVYAARALCQSLSLNPASIDEVICGSAMPAPSEANIARVISLRMGCGEKVPAYTVQRNCAAGLQALDSAWQQIVNGKADLVLAGGCDAMSRAPLLFSPALTRWFAGWMSSKSVKAKLQTLLQFRPNSLAPEIALLSGLTDPFTGLSMGQTAEELAYRFALTRQLADEYAVRSHLRLSAAQDQGYLNEITPLYDAQGNYYTYDDGVRPDSSVERLAKLRPMFDKKFGQVTAGNSSQITDGAAFVLLANAQAVERYQLPVLAKLVDIRWAGLAPEVMGLGPVHAMAKLLEHNSMPLSAIDYFEINEAFAAQVLSCVSACADTAYCSEQLATQAALGTIDSKCLNVDGGAIALGHPIGASGARIVLHLAHVLQRQQAQTGIASLCIGGGQGGAALLERVG